MNHKVNLEEENIVNVLLEGAGFSSFVFHTHFQLVFNCDINKKFHEKNLPREVTLTILGDWYFGNKVEWDETVRKMTEGKHFVEPDEPVLAFKLAALRWMNGSVVSSVVLSPEKMEIKFQCGEIITILSRNNSEGDYPWEIYECAGANVNSDWSVVCDEGEIYCNSPT